MKITQELLLQLFSYNPDTGVVIHNDRPRDWFGEDRTYKAWVTKCKGKDARIRKCSRGDECAYYVLSLRHSKQIYAHRAIWLMMTGEPAPSEIDHINHDGLDNRWSNLRNGDVVNRYNLSIARNNTSGATGVVWDKVNNKWAVRVKFKGKHLYYGRFESFSDAKEACKEARRELGLFHELHGEKRISAV